MIQQGSESPIEIRLRSIRILWLAMLLSVGVYYVFTHLVGPRENVTPNSSLSLVLLVAGIFAILISIPIKKKLLARAVEQQQLPMVQQAYVAAFAVCEVATLLGLVDFFITGHKHYYLLFIVSAFGQLINFPQRKHVLDASFKKSMP